MATIGRRKMTEKRMGLTEAKKVAQQAANLLRAFQEIEAAAETALVGERQLRELQRQIKDAEDRLKATQEHFSGELYKRRQDLAHAESALAAFIEKSKEERRKHTREANQERKAHEEAFRLQKEQDEAALEKLSSAAAVKRKELGKLDGEIKSLKQEALRLKERAGAL